MPKITPLSNETQIHIQQEQENLQEISGIGIQKNHTINAKDLMDLIYQTNDMPISHDERQKYLKGEEKKESESIAEPIEDSPTWIEEPNHLLDECMQPTEGSEENHSLIQDIFQQNQTVPIKGDYIPLNPVTVEIKNETTASEEEENSIALEKNPQTDNHSSTLDDEFEPEWDFEEESDTSFDEFDEMWEDQEPEEELEDTSNVLDNNSSEKEDFSIDVPIENEVKNPIDTTEHSNPSLTKNPSKTKIKIVHQKPIVTEKKEEEPAIVQETNPSKEVIPQKSTSIVQKIWKQLKPLITIISIFCLAIVFYIVTTLLTPKIEAITNKRNQTNITTQSATTDPSLNVENKVSIAIQEVEGADGYEVSYSTNYNFPDNETTTIEVKSAQQAMEGLEKGYTYYVRIRAFHINEDGTKTYGDYTDIQEIHM